MKKMRSAIATVVALVSGFSLCACGNKGGGSESLPTGDEEIVDEIVDEIITTPEEIVTPTVDDMFSDADKNPHYDEENAVEIVLSTNGINCASGNVAIDNGFATISSGGSYVVSGSGTNQTIIVDAADEKVRLVFSGATITNDTFAPVYVKNADKTFVILEGENQFVVTDDFEKIDDNKVDGVIFAKDDITVQGDGKLIINSSKHGIVGKDDVKISGGATVEISSNNHGIQAKDSVRAENCDVKITSGKDGIHAENEDDESKGFVYIESGNFDFNAGYDGIDASASVNVVCGTFNIKSGGGSSQTLSDDDSSMKGIKSDGDMKISSGDITVDSRDDSIHSNSSIEISGGTFELSSGDDGVHADSSLIISGGNVTISKSYEGLEAQNLTVSGGNISIVASDDGINAAGGNDSSSIGGRPGQNGFNSNVTCFITISGGEIYVNAGGDGVDSNGNIVVKGGKTIVEGPTDNGNGPLDYDGTATITGGVFVAIGSSGMAMNFSSASQGSILLTVGNQNAGTDIVVTGNDGEIFSMTASKPYASVLVSSPQLVKGGSYTVTAGGKNSTVKLSSLIYGSGMGGGMSGGGGFPGGGFPGGWH